ncbi:MAG: alpha/beta family hydrolase [Ilumatobacteraceae bacterium]
MSVSPSLLLFPGAGSDRDHASLVALAEAVAPRRCDRVDFPYRRAGRRAPDRAPVLVQAVEDAAREIDGPLVLGGRSMGGRMCSMAVAEGRVPNAVGLVLVSYPLHPPGKPDRLRVEHLPALTVPCLFVHGTKDAPAPATSSNGGPPRSRAPSPTCGSTARATTCATPMRRSSLR